MGPFLHLNKSGDKESLKIWMLLSCMKNHGRKLKNGRIKGINRKSVRRSLPLSLLPKESPIFFRAQVIIIDVWMYKIVKSGPVKKNRSRSGQTVITSLFSDVQWYPRIHKISFQVYNVYHIIKYIIRYVVRVKILYDLRLIKRF